MGFGLAISDDTRVEAIKNDKFIKLTVRHGDASPGESSITFSTQQLTAYISCLRVIAAHLGLPLKTVWESDYISSTLDHEGIGRPVTPRKSRPIPLPPTNPFTELE